MSGYAYANISSNLSLIIMICKLLLVFVLFNFAISESSGLSWFPSFSHGNHGDPQFKSFQTHSLHRSRRAPTASPSQSSSSAEQSPESNDKPDDGGGSSSGSSEEKGRQTTQFRIEGFKQNFIFYDIVLITEPLKLLALASTTGAPANQTARRRRSVDARPAAVKLPNRKSSDSSSVSELEREFKELVRQYYTLVVS